jgi:DNA-binding transcriptional LysR family regulator
MLDALCVQFALDFPEVQLEVHQTTRHVDLIADGIDVAVRLGRVRDPNLIARKVIDGRRVVVGSVDYLARRGTPTTPEELAGHDCLVDFAGQLTPQRRWPLLAGGEVAVSGPLAGNSVMLLRRAVLAGMGLALLPRALVAEDLDAGRMVVVLEDHVGSDASMSLVYAEREFVDPKVRVFVDRVVRELGERITSVGRPPREAR